MRPLVRISHRWAYESFSFGWGWKAWVWKRSTPDAMLMPLHVTLTYRSKAEATIAAKRWLNERPLKEIAV